MITLAMIDAGGGHRSPAVAVKQALESYGPNYDAELLDFHEAVKAIEFDATHKKSWNDMLRSPLLTYAGTKALEAIPGEVTRSFVVRWSKEAVDKGAHWILKNRPEVFFSTHYLNIPPALEARNLARRMGIDLPTKIILFAAEAFTLSSLWIWKEIDELVVASPEAYAHAISLGMPRSKVRLFPYPVRKEFGLPRKSEDPIKTLGSRPLRVMAMSGAEGKGKIETILSKLIQADLPIELKVVCGRNEELRQSLQTQAADLENTKLVAHGFVDKVWDLMDDSDLVLGKAGPASMFEALHRTLPIVFFDAVTTSEFANIAYAQDNGIGWFLRESWEIPEFISSLTEDPSTIVESRERIQRLRLKNGASEIAHYLLSFTESRNGLRHLEGRE